MEHWRLCEPKHTQNLLLTARNVNETRRAKPQKSTTKKVTIQRCPDAYPTERLRGVPLALQDASMEG